MNKKGFTLVELLAVIALLGLIVGICVPSIMNASTNVKKKTLQTKVDNIEKAAVLYGQKNRENFNSSCSLCDGITGECFCYDSVITVEKLREEKYIQNDEGTEDIVNPVSEESLLECKVQIYKKYNKIYAVYDKDTNKNNCWYE